MKKLKRESSKRKDEPYPKDGAVSGNLYQRKPSLEVDTWHKPGLGPTG